MRTEKPVSQFYLDLKWNPPVQFIEEPMTISQDISNWIVGDQCAYSPYCSLNIS